MAMTLFVRVKSDLGVEEVVAKTVDRPLTSDELLDALDRLRAWVV